MEKVVFFSLVVSVLFLIFKFLEMKYIDHAYKPAREIIRDLLMVGVSSFLGAFILLRNGNSVSKLMDVITDKKISPLDGASVFTDNPNF